MPLLVRAAGAAVARPLRENALGALHVVVCDAAARASLEEHCAGALRLFLEEAAACPCAWWSCPWPWGFFFSACPWSCDGSSHS